MRASLLWILVATAAVSCGGNNQKADDVPEAPCSDGVDNDNDGTIDFPDDLGCMGPLDDTEDSPTNPQCDDGRDNDGDGKADYPADPGCFAPAADDETDDCPDGPQCPQCGNGKDDDMNGATDYPGDTGCESAADSSEFLNNPVACGGGLKIKQLPPTGIDRGMLDSTSTSMIMSPCGGGGGAPAIAYTIHLTAPKVIVASTDDSATVADTVLDIRAADCMNPASELACSDDIDGTNTNSSLTESLQAGTYYLIVSGHDTSSIGAYTLTVQLFTGETPDGMLLAPGTGDNMGAALGLDLGPGDVVVSLGTSGTVFAVSDRPAADPSGIVAGFADATGRFLPLVCTLNAARVVGAALRMAGAELSDLDRLALSVEGTEGLVLLPFLDGERTPALPDATGVLHGLTRHNATPAHLVRASVEGMLCGLADAVEPLQAAGVTPRRIVLIGGAARSAAVQRIAAGLFALPVEVPEPAEYVALGAARQAAWTLAQDEAAPRWPREATVVQPDEGSAEYYAGIRAAYSSVLRDAHPLLTR